MVKEKTSLELDPEFTLIREAASNRPGRIYSESSFVKDLDFGDNKKIFIQEYKKEKLIVDANHIEVMIRFWDTQNWVLSDPVEILINKSGKISELLESICRHFPQIHVRLNYKRFF